MESHMKQTAILTTTSVLSILLMTFHLADDIVREFEPRGFKNLTGVLTLVVWIYGTLALAEPRSAHVIILLGSLLGSDRPFQRNVVLGLDARRARRDLHVLCRPRGARSVEPAVTPAAAVAPGAMARLALR
jgi:hypothetical protein